MAVSLSQCHKSGDMGEDLEIVFCRSSLIPHQATMDSKSGMLFLDSLYYYVLYSNYGDLGRIVSCPTVGIRANHGLESKHMNWNHFLGFYSRGFCPVSEISSNQNLNFIAYLESTRQDEKIGGWHVTGGGRMRPHAPPRARSET